VEKKNAEKKKKERGRIEMSEGAAQQSERCASFDLRDVSVSRYDTFDNEWESNHMQA
jgi:hypothetical protein